MNIYRFAKTDTGEALLFALASTVAFLTLFAAGGQVYAATQTANLTVTVNTALTFSLTNNNFTSINPGTPSMATSTLTVTTNDSLGYFVGLSGDQKSTTFNNFELIGASSTSITDQQDIANTYEARYLVVP